MGLGASLFLLAAGAILAFAVDAPNGWLDLQVVGWVLMGCGLIGLIFTVSIMSRRRRTVVEPARPVPPGHQVVEDVPEYDVDRRL